MRRQSRMSSKIVGGAVKRHEALKLRLEGNTYQEIGDALSISKTAAYKLIESAFLEEKEKYLELAEVVRYQELSRLDLYLKSLKAKLDNGEINAINAALRIMERRAFYIPTEIVKDEKPASVVSEIDSKALEELSVDELTERYGS